MDAHFFNWNWNNWNNGINWNTQVMCYFSLSTKPVTTISSSAASRQKS